VIIAGDVADLSIRLTKIRRDGSIKVEFSNDSNHELRLPFVIYCCGTFPGTLHAELLERPDKKGHSNYGMGCTLCGSKAPSVLEQAKQWTVLRPGQSTNIMAQLNGMLPVDEEGVYQFRLAYTRPGFTPDEWQQLKDAGIEVPMTDSESRPIIIELLAGRNYIASSTP